MEMYFAMAFQTLPHLRYWKSRHNKWWPQWLPKLDHDGLNVALPILRSIPGAKPYMLLGVQAAKAIASEYDEAVAATKKKQNNDQLICGGCRYFVWIYKCTKWSVPLQIRPHCRNPHTLYNLYRIRHRRANLVCTLPRCTT